jgi:hypothetical protein
MKILANPSTQVILEALRYEYSDRGHADFRRECPDIIAPLVRAIVAELQRNSIFPATKKISDIGVFIQKRGDEFVLSDVDKPSVRDDYSFLKAEDAAHGYVRKILDAYWLKSDKDSRVRPRR